MDADSATRPTEAQIGLMYRAWELRRYHGADGIYPRGGQLGALVRLEKAGLMRFVGIGSCIDGERENEQPIWEITDRGEDLLRDLGEIE